MKIKKNELINIIKTTLNEAKIRIPGENIVFEDPPENLKPENIKKQIEDLWGGPGKDGYFKKEVDMLRSYGYKNIEDLMTPDPDDPEKGYDLRTIPVDRAIIDFKDNTLGPYMSGLKGSTYVIEPEDFSGMKIGGVDLRKELVDRMKPTYPFEDETGRGFTFKVPQTDERGRKSYSGAPYKVFVMDDTYLTRNKPITRQRPTAGEQTKQMDYDDPTVSMNDMLYGVTEEAPDYPEDTLKLPKFTSDQMSTEEKVNYAKSVANLEDDEFLKTSNVGGYDYFFDKEIPGEELDIEDEKSRKYMEKSRKKQ